MGIGRQLLKTLPYEINVLSSVPGENRFMVSYPVSEFLDLDQFTVNFRAPLSFRPDVPQETRPECVLISAFVQGNPEMEIQFGYDAVGINRKVSSVQPAAHILDSPVETVMESGWVLFAQVPVRRVKLVCNSLGNGISEDYLETAYRFENAARKFRIQFMQRQCNSFGRRRIDVG